MAESSMMIIRLHMLSEFFSQAICQIWVKCYVHVHLQQANKPQ